MVSTLSDVAVIYDVLLICALKDEYDQVLNVTEGIKEEGWRTISLKNKRIASTAKFNSKEGHDLTIIVTWTGYMGREQCQAVTSGVIREIQAHCIAMCGICAGRRNKISLGDVIFADRLWSCDTGKIVEIDNKRLFQADPLHYRLPETWIQHMQSVEVSSKPWVSLRPTLSLEYQEIWVLQRLYEGVNPPDHQKFLEKCPDWTEVIKRLIKKEWVQTNPQLQLSERGQEKINHFNLLYPKGGPEPAPFKTHVAPIATVAAVTEDDSVFNRLQESMRKVLGLDMESSALAALGESFDMPVIVAKGVSDYADNFKDDRYRLFAARASAEALIALLRMSYSLYCKAPLLHQDRTPVNLLQKNIVETFPHDLIETLAELYTDIEAARAIWERAGGKSSQLEYSNRPKDMWQKIWKLSLNGASVRPEHLLSTILGDYPDNEMLRKHLSEKITR